jgi:general stress protein 26
MSSVNEGIPSTTVAEPIHVAVSKVDHPPRRGLAMHTPKELEQKFWKALKSDRTVMLGLADADEGHTRPMTAMLEEDDRGPIWFFTSVDNALVSQLPQSRKGFFAFGAKGHALFATVSGDLSRTHDRAIVERLWNPFVAAWYEGGKDDPKLVLLRFDAHRAEIWLNETGLLAGVKMLMGGDPKEEYRDHVAEVDLR